MHCKLNANQPRRSPRSLKTTANLLSKRENIKEDFVKQHTYVQQNYYNSNSCDVISCSHLGSHLFYVVPSAPAKSGSMHLT